MAADRNFFNWRNNTPEISNDEKRCKFNASTPRCHLNSFVFTICTFLFLSVVLFASVYLGLRQHLNGAGVLWPTIMNNTSTNQTADVEVRLPSNQHDRHSWHYNTLILRAWLGTCLALGLLIGLTLIILIWNFIWKKYHPIFRRYFGMRSRETKRDSEHRQFEMKDIETQACFLENVAQS